MFKTLLPLALFAISAPMLAEQPVTAAQTGLQQQVEGILSAAPTGVQFGLLVMDEGGRTVVSVNPDQRFIPASNTKMFTTAAAYALLPDIDLPDTAGGTQVLLERSRSRGRAPDVVLRGRGDARMSSAPGCTENCLSALADAIAAQARRVHDVIGDDTFWADQRWAPGMSWNNIGTDSGTAVSALNLDDNELRLVVTPSAPGQAPAINAPAYFTLVNAARTAAPGGKLTLSVERPVNGMTVRLSGEIPADAKRWGVQLGIDDPAHYAAWRLKEMLAARGVRVDGAVQVRHRLPGQGLPAADAAQPLAALVPLPLAADVVRINKDSQNLHAQALFRRLGGPLPVEAGPVAVTRALFETNGIPPKGFELSDGSGMSTYNRVSPRAVVALLGWIDRQPWAAGWHASLPVAGRDGTLKRRFIGTALEGNLAAKTGSINATNALSGTFRTARGRRFSFAFLANDVPGGASVLAVMEAALVQIAAAN